MKTIKFLLVLVAFPAFLGSCEKEKVVVSQLEGTWIEQKDKSDTITFAVGEQFFSLRRGREIRDGYSLPKHGSGIYEYKAKEDSLSLYNTLSSCYCFHDYYIKIENEAMVIGDFYHENSTGKELLTFIKQK